jgi:cell wall-associated NlpC family hydrolase
MGLDLSNYFNKPYKTHGRGPDAYDCYGCALALAKDLGHNVPDLFKLLKQGDPRNSDFVALSEGLEKVDTPSFGDIVIFLNEKGLIYHCGIVLKNGDFIHCDKEGVQISNFAYYPNKGEFYTWHE